MNILIEIKTGPLQTKLLLCSSVLHYYLPSKKGLNMSWCASFRHSSSVHRSAVMNRFLLQIYSKERISLTKNPVSDLCGSSTGGTECQILKQSCRVAFSLECGIKKRRKD